MIITVAHVKEARKLLGWSVPDPTAPTALDVNHLDAFERRKRRMSVLDLLII